MYYNKLKPSTNHQHDQKYPNIKPTLKKTIKNQPAINTFNIKQQTNIKNHAESNEN